MTALNAIPFHPDNDVTPEDRKLVERLIAATYAGQVHWIKNEVPREPRIGIDLRTYYTNYVGWFEDVTYRISEGFDCTDCFNYTLYVQGIPNDRAVVSHAAPCGDPAFPGCLSHRLMDAVHGITPERRAQLVEKERQYLANLRKERIASEAEAATPKRRSWFSRLFN